MQARLLTAWDELPAILQSALRPFLCHAQCHAQFPAMLTAAQAQSVRLSCGLTDEQLCAALLPLAAACALVPVSHFRVGAVAIGASGNLYFGANMEFFALPLQQTVHAEQCAITHAWLRGESALASLSVNYSPCGHCRQFMNELRNAAALPIYLPGRAPGTLADYLPCAFGPDDLGVTTFLMDKCDHGYRLAQADSLAQAALDAASQSHAPYTQSHSGIALETTNGTIYSGRYAENAAFNPGLPPLQTALIMMMLSGTDFSDIRRAVLAESVTSGVIQWESTHLMLRTLGCQDISRLLFEPAG